MKLNLKLYGITKEIIGSSELEYSMEEPASVSGLREALASNFPELQKLASLAIAVNGEYAQSDFLLAENDEVVLIPPVSGG